MKFIIESSVVPIYNRIATAFATTLIQFGHTVYFINAAEFTDTDFVNTVNRVDIDYYFSTNELNKIHQWSNSLSCFLFEKIERKIIFIHHDNLFSAFHDIEYIHNKLLSLKRINQKSTHFCLEKSNIETLNAYEITSAFQIYHASEFLANSEVSDTKYGATFIGHLMSSIKGYPSNGLAAGLHLETFAWNRLSRSSYSIQPEIKRLIEDESFVNSLGPVAKINKIATHHFLVAGLNKFSSAMRGQLISSIKDQRIDIFGGDLSYGKIKDPLMTINQSNIHYQPATSNYQDAQNIYNQSKISINISSLQFDTAVNNRVIDCILSGGFILTDLRNDLINLTKEYKYISYDSPEELNEKIKYYMDLKNTKIYEEIKYSIYEEFKERFNYQSIVNSLLSSILSKEANA